jgi:hypothetical protein
VVADVVASLPVVVGALVSVAVEELVSTASDMFAVSPAGAYVAVCSTP